VSAHDSKDVARLREAFASRQDEGTGEPVDPERIFDALHGNVTREERQAVVEQLLTDPAAAEAWRLARDMRPDSGVTATGTIVIGSFGGASWD
jgi:hypothetical protein